jgi:uncharacterized protein YjdB
MRRLIMAGLLFTVACTDESGPNTVAELNILTDASPLGVFVGDHVQMSSIAYSINGEILAPTVTWSSSNPSVATITNTGAISAVAPGSTNIGASAGKISVTVPFVVDGNLSSTVTVTPANPVVTKGTTQVLAAAITTSQGNPARNKTVVWTTADGTKVGVDQTGLASAIASTAATGVLVCAAVSDAPTIKGCTTVVVP